MKWRIVWNGLLLTSQKACFYHHHRSSSPIRPPSNRWMGRKNQPTEETVHATEIKLFGNQKLYTQYLKNDTLPLVVCTGAAGTGKTMLACKEAVRRLEDPGSTTDKIIITRPTVMADDELGFLPGEIESKMQPWTRPLFDYLYEFSSRNKVQTWLKNGELEILPLGYMRGRTFKRSFIIGDECQNIQVSSMKMLLTRIGEDSKMVIVGDPEQSDLFQRTKSPHNGLEDFIDRVYHSYSRQHQEGDGNVDVVSTTEPLVYKGIARVHLGSNCIRRHPIITHILDIY